MHFLSDSKGRQNNELVRNRLQHFFQVARFTKNISCEIEEMLLMDRCNNVRRTVEKQL